MTAKQTTDLTANQQAAIDYLMEHTSATSADIAAAFGVKVNRVAPTLTALAKKGLIVKSDEDGKFRLPLTVQADQVAEVDAITEDVAADIAASVEAITANPEATAPAGSPDEAVDKARELQKAEAGFEVTKAGTHAKVVTVGKAYVTTDGKFVTAKVGADKAEPWVLLAVPAKGKPKKVGTFKSSSAALLLEVLGHEG